MKEEIENNTENFETVLKIEEMIESIKPYISMDGGNIKFIKYENNIVYIALGGACAACSMQDVTINNGITEMLKAEIPEIKEVINVTNQ